jgi:hypothetical protein
METRPRTVEAGYHRRITSLRVMWSSYEGPEMQRGKPVNVQLGNR